MAVSQAILALNAGSSSIKFAAFEVGADELTLICKGLLDRRADNSGFVIKYPAGNIIEASDAAAAGSDSTSRRP